MILYKQANQVCVRKEQSCREPIVCLSLPLLAEISMWPRILTNCLQVLANSWAAFAGAMQEQSH